MAKVKSSSLLEATLAMGILSIVFTLFWMCVGQLTATSQLPLHWKSGIAIDQVAATTKLESEFFDTRLELNGFYILRKVKETHFGENLFVLQLDAFNSQDKLITSKREIIYVE